MQEHKQQEEEFSFKSFFVPLTTIKAIHWIIVIGLIVYFNSLFNGFVWDDFSQLINNNTSHSLINISQFFSNHSYTYYRPFSAVVLAGMYMAFTTTAFWYHFVQIILHIINTIFIFILFKRFFKLFLSFILAGVFLIHPMNVESAAYISSLQAVLSLLFGLSALVIVSYKKQQSVFQYLLLSLFFLLSILSKETGIIFCILTPLLMAFNKKIRYEKREYMLISLSIVLAISFYVYLTFFYGNIPKETLFFSPVPIVNASLFIKLLTFPKILFYYLLTFVYPVQLAVSQQWLVRSLSVEEFYIPLFVDIFFFTGLVITGIYLWRTKLRDTYIFFLLWFLFSWGMVFQIISLDMTVADRWFYVPMIGLLGVLGSLITNIKVNNTILKQCALWFLVIILLLFSLRTMVRLQNWNNNFTLFTHDEQISTVSYDIEDQLSNQYLTASEYDQAKPHIMRSIQFAPKYWGNWNNLGVYYEGTGQINQSIKAIFQAVDNNPNYYNGYINLASIYFHYKNPSEARVKIGKILMKYPHDPLLLVYMAIVEYKVKDTTLAKNSIAQAYKYNQSADIRYIYDSIMNNQPLDVVSK